MNVGARLGCRDRSERRAPALVRTQVCLLARLRPAGDASVTALLIVDVLVALAGAARMPIWKFAAWTAVGNGGLTWPLLWPVAQW